MEKSKVGIIICTYNQDKLMKKCLKSIKKVTSYKNYKVFFVDDSGKGKYGEIVKKNFKWANVTIKKENTGFSSSNNIGIKKAIENYNPEYILLLNDDTEIIQKDWLDKIIKVGNSDDKIGIIGCNVLNPDKSLQWPSWKNKNEKNIQKIDNVIGCCLMFKRKVSDKIGLLDEKFDPVYGEETDFCYRTKKAGFNVVYTPNANIVHHDKSSTKKLEDNFVWFIKKRHAIRLEFLNLGFFQILKKQLIHFGSVFIYNYQGKIKVQKNMLNKFGLLMKAYFTNIKDAREIYLKRKERNNY
jgi:GT2 family glycosyltransferase